MDNPEGHRLHLSWHRDHDGVVAIYGTDENTGKIANLGDLWLDHLVRMFGWRREYAKQVQTELADMIVETWNAKQVHADTTGLWRPIGSAPKDGTAILASGQNRGRHYVITRWEQCDDPQPDDWSGWYEPDGDGGPYPFLTHWRPLPPHPKDPTND